MGMASFPTLWQCLRCRMHIPVNQEKGQNYRAPQGFVQIWCPNCKAWGNPVAPNGRLAQ